MAGGPPGRRSLRRRTRRSFLRRIDVPPHDRRLQSGIGGTGGAIADARLPVAGYPMGDAAPRAVWSDGDLADEISQAASRRAFSRRDVRRRAAKMISVGRLRSGWRVQSFLTTEETEEAESRRTQINGRCTARLG